MLTLEHTRVPTPALTSAPRTSRWTEILAGVVGAVGSMPINVANGTVAFAPLGADAGLGAAAALASSAVAGAVLGALSASTPMAAGAAAALSLSVSATLAAALDAGLLADPATRVGGAVAITAVLTILAACAIAGLTVLRLGRLAAFVPYPVLSGFLNGTAGLLVLGQLGALVGGTPGHVPGLDAWRPLTLVVALAGLCAVLLPAPGIVRRVPALFRGLVVACATDAALRWAGHGALLGPLLGVSPSLQTHASNLAAGLAALPGLQLQPILPTLLVSAATIAVLAMLDTLGTAGSLRERGGPRVDVSQDFGALAAANFCSGVAGGLPVCGSIVATNSVYGAGGRARLATVVRAAAVALFLAFGGPLLALVPQAAFSAVILGLAWNLSDGSILRSLRGAGARHRLADALVMGAVTAVAVMGSLVAAVAAGLLLAVLAFTASMARGVVRRAARNPGGRSRTRWPAPAEAVLLAAGGQIEVVELEGALFFGSAEAVAAHVERAAATGAGFIILDVSRVTRIDLSGGRQVLRLLRHPPLGAAVLLGGLRPGGAAHGDLHALRLLPALPPGSCFDAVEGAVAQAEATILAEAGTVTDAGHGPVDTLVRLGLPPHLAARLCAAMAERHIPAGTKVIARGDPPDAMFVLLAGVADVSVPRPGQEGALRIMTLMPGAVFGEMAFLTGQARSADVWARTALHCLCLDQATMAGLERDDPALSAALFRAVALQLDSNLRRANTTLLSWES